MKKNVYLMALATVLIAGAGLCGYLILQSESGTAPASVAEHGGSQTIATTSGSGASTEAASGRAVNFENLAHDLAGADEAVRQAAQRLLAEIPYQQREQLEKLADSVSDAGVKAQLVRRGEEIEKQLTLNPPPISLHVKDAPLYDVITALNDEMGVHIAWTSGAQSNLYTLDAENKPFWEIFAALNAQHPLMIQPGLQLTLMETDSPMSYSISGPYMFGARLQTIGFANPGKGQSPLKDTLWTAVAVDPRATLITPYFSLSIGPDDLGNELGSSGSAIAFPHQMSTTGFSEGKLLPERHAGAKRIRAVSATLRALAVIESTRAEVQGAETGFTVQVGDLTITGTPLTEIKGRGSERFMATRTNGTVGTAMYRLIDVNGQARRATNFLGSGTMNWTDGLAVPYRLQIRVPTKTQAVEATFSLKDLPYPVR